MPSQLRFALTLMTASLVGLLIIQRSAPLRAQAQKFVYIAEGCQHFSKEVPPGTFDDKSFEGPQMTMGDRLEVLEDASARYKVRAYDGRVAFIAKTKVRAEDPKSYFSATLGGRKVVGFLRGPKHCSFIDRVKAIVDSGGETDVPISRISRLEAGPNGLKILTDDGSEYVSSVAQWNQSWGGSPAFFHYGQLPGIRSGSGAELPISRSRIAQPIVLVRMTVE